LSETVYRPNVLLNMQLNLTSNCTTLHRLAAVTAMTVTANCLPKVTIQVTVN